MEDEIKKLLEKNLELNQEIHKMVKSIRVYVIGQRIWFVIKMLFILVPVILGFIYLPPLVKDLMDKYHNLLNFSGGNVVEGLFNRNSSPDFNNLKVDDLPPDAQQYLR